MTAAWSVPTTAAAPTPRVYDDGELEPVAVSRSAGSVADDEPAESYGHS
jgi:hypothetical protein